MGVLVEDLLTLARLDEIAEAPRAEVRPRTRSPATPSTTPAPPPPTGRSRCDGDGDARSCSGDAAPAPSGAREPAPQRARPHARRAPRSRLRVRPKRAARYVLHRSRSWRRPSERPTRRCCSGASGAPRKGVSADGRAQGSGSRSSRRSSTPTAGRWTPPTRTAAGAVFVRGASGSAGNVNCGWVGRLGCRPPLGERTCGRRAGAKSVKLPPETRRLLHRHLRAIADAAGTLPRPTLMPPLTFRPAHL